MPEQYVAQQDGILQTMVDLWSIPFIGIICKCFIPDTIRKIKKKILCGGHMFSLSACLWSFSKQL